MDFHKIWITGILRTTNEMTKCCKFKVWISH